MERFIWMTALVGALYFAYWTTQRSPEQAISRQSSASPSSVEQTASLAASSSRRMKLGKHNDGPEYFDDFNPALTYARSVSKPLVIVFGASYCGACHEFVEETCASSDIQKYYERFVWVYMDTEQEPSRVLRQSHPDKSFHTIPHVWFIRWDGAFISEEGYMPEPMTFASRLETVLAGLPSSR